jgi:membrane protein YqaA with SNARE-associated domain
MHNALHSFVHCFSCTFVGKFLHVIVRIFNHLNIVQHFCATEGKLFHLMSTSNVDTIEVHYSDTIPSTPPSDACDGDEVASVVLKPAECVLIDENGERLGAPETDMEEIASNVSASVEGSDGESLATNPTLGPCDSDLAVKIDENGEKEVVEIDEGELVTESPTPVVEARYEFDVSDGKEDNLAATVEPVPADTCTTTKGKKGDVSSGDADAFPPKTAAFHNMLQEDFVIDVGTAKRVGDNEVLDVAVITYITTPPRRSKDDDSLGSILPASKRTLAIRVAIAFVIMMILGICVAYFLGGYVEDAARVFVGNFGLYGIFFAMLIMDSIPFSPTEACLMMGLAFGINIWLLMIVASIGSVLAGPLSWAIGLTILAKSPRFLLMLQRNKVAPVLAKHTVGCVSLAAILPVWDYTVTNYCAGAIKTKVFDVFKGSLWRIPRVFLTVLILYVGWEFARGE